ncbi:MAG: ABC transporter ATP-binding protein [Cyclobacteriaceae bacterium]|nr:MAG: ABC transporter ATP-binding protein [Cyclobacteriaceae bacterium]
MNTPLVKAVDIRKSYGALNVLKGIDLEVAAGEVVAIVGASGAGKSTLLHILGTLDVPDQGTLFLRDQDVFRFSSTKLAAFRNKSVGFVFQFHNLLPEFSALENVMIPGWIAGRSKQEITQRAKELLTMLGLASRMEHKPSEMSGGEQQRTAVARALINDPVLVLADEPSGNLDSKNAQELHQLFFDLRKQLNQTFIIVTHNQEFAGMADRTIEIKDGQVAKR